MARSTNAHPVTPRLTPAYRTLREYNSLMEEAVSEFRDWEALQYARKMEHRRKRRALA